MSTDSSAKYYRVNKERLQQEFLKDKEIKRTKRKRRIGKKVTIWWWKI